MEDKLFIEQSCFTSLANMCLNIENSNLKERLNFVYGVSELAGVLNLVGKE